MPDELLTAIPVSGAFPERRYTPSATANTWVRFEGDPDWVGIFGNSPLAHYSDLVPFAHDSSIVLVIAGGQGYIINRDTGQLVRRTPWDYTYAALPIPGTDQIVMADPWTMWITTPLTEQPILATSALYKGEPLSRIALDGIIFENLTSDRLTGAYEHVDGWYRFVLNLRSLEVVRGSKIADTSPGLAAPTGRGFPLDDAAEQRRRAVHLMA